MLRYRPSWLVYDKYSQACKVCWSKDMACVGIVWMVMGCEMMIWFLVILSSMYDEKE